MKNGDHTSDFVHSIPDDSAIMLAYWGNDLLCHYANDAYLKWFGKDANEGHAGISMAALLRGAYDTYSAYMHRVLAGEACSFEMVWAQDTRQPKKAYVRYLPDYIGEEVRGFIVNAVDVTAVNGMMSADWGGAGDEHVLALGDPSDGFSMEMESLRMVFEAARGGEVQGRKVFETSIEGKFKGENYDVHPCLRDALHTEEVNLYDSVMDALSSTQALLSENTVSVRVKVSPFIYVDVNRTYARNIVASFLKYMVSYMHASRPLVIDVSTMVVGDETVLSLRDNGAGVDLQRFHMGSDAGGEESVHSLVYRASQQIYAMGGFVGAESIPGVGSWFRLYFKTRAQHQLRSM